jgi:hypothetical protein
MLPAGLCGLLATAAAVQIALPAETPIPQGNGTGRSLAWALPDVGEPGNLTDSLTPKLFSPTRLGAKLGEVLGDGEAAAEAPEPPPPKPKKPVGPLDGAWVLGTVRVDTANVVVLRLATGAILKLPLDHAWHGWRLTSVQDNFALFQRSGKTRRINFGNAPSGAFAASDSENNSE